MARINESGYIEIASCRCGFIGKKTPFTDMMRFDIHGKCELKIWAIKELAGRKFKLKVEMIENET